MMALPKKLSDWNKFIKWFSSHEGYWYFAKGRVVESDQVIEAFRILASNYEGEIWKDVQDSFLDDLEAAKLFNRRGKNQSPADKTAMARVWKVVFSTLGFAWVEQDDKVAITIAGKEFLSANNPHNPIENQVQRYQISNPTIKPKKHREIKVCPHVFLLDVLLKSDNFITDREYVLFVSRAKSHDEVDLVVKFIKKWRKLKKPTKEIIYNEAKECIKDLPGRRTNLVNTIELNKSYALSFLSFCSYLEKGEPKNKDFAIKLEDSKKHIATAEHIVKKFENESVFIEYRNAKDWFSYYGVPNKMPTKEEAIDYYVDTSQTENLSNKSLAVDAQTVKAQIKEKILEDHLEKNLDDLEDGLTLVERQFATITGPIDLLCKDKNNNFVVVELKKGRASDKVIGQITRYMGFVKTQMIENSKQAVRGIIVGREIDKSLEMSCVIINAGADVSLRTFDATITINTHT